MDMLAETVTEMMGTDFFIAENLEWCLILKENTRCIFIRCAQKVTP